MNRHYLKTFGMRWSVAAMIAAAGVMSLGVATTSLAQDAAPAAPAPAVPVAPVEPAPAPAPAAPASQATSAPATTQAAPVAAADQTTPRGALKMLAASMESGDQGKILAVLHATTPIEERMSKAMADMAGAYAKFRVSMIEAYGEAGARELIGELPPPGESDRLIDDATETVTGNEAIVQLGTQNPPAKLAKIDDKWKLPVANLAPGLDPAAVDEIVESNVMQVTAMTTIAEEVTQKKYKTVAEVRTALNAKVQQLVEDRRKAATAPSSAPAQGPAPAEAPVPAPPATDAAPVPPAAPAPEAAPAPAAPAAPAAPTPAAPAK